MAGNNARRGATRNAGSKKGATVGSGGQRRKGLQGKGPTPKAVERDKHPAARRARAAAKRDDLRRTSPGRSRSSGRSGRSGGRDGGSEVVYGRNAVVEALRAGVPASELFVAERIESDDRVRESLKLAADAHIPLLQAARVEIDAMAGGGVHQGLVLRVPEYEYAHPDDLLARATGDPLVVALDGVTDPRNLGAVVRSAGAFGAHGVLVPSRRSAGMTASAWKTSAGAAARVPVARAANLNRALADYRSAGLFVVGLDADAESELAGLEVVDGPLVLVVGSEGKGLSRLVRESCDVIASIPIAATTESLNASVAASIALYEVARARRA